VQEAYEPIRGDLERSQLSLAEVIEEADDELSAGQSDPKCSEVQDEPQARSAIVIRHRIRPMCVRR